MKNLVVFASGSGTNFQSIIDAAENGQLPAKVAGLITNKADIGAIERARKHDTPCRTISPKDFDSDGAFAKALLEQLHAWQADVLILAGYLKKIPLEIIEAFPDNILNIHPSLLPKYGGKGFYGLKVHRAVIEAGETESGCSVHIVTEEFDKGPVLAQSKVPVKQGDTPETLAKRVLAREHSLYPEVIRKHILKQL